MATINASSAMITAMVFIGTPFSIAGLDAVLAAPPGKAGDHRVTY
jgi:hypothetical protein